MSLDYLLRKFVFYREYSGDVSGPLFLGRNSGYFTSQRGVVTLAETQDYPPNMRKGNMKV